MISFVLYGDGTLQYPIAHSIECLQMFRQFNDVVTDGVWGANSNFEPELVLVILSDSGLHGTALITDGHRQRVFPCKIAVSTSGVKYIRSMALVKLERWKNRSFSNYFGWPASELIKMVETERARTKVRNRKQ